ncbi:MAG: hypothetical protein ABI895_35405 [Deltaproteobacteria bacterium]
MSAQLPPSSVPFCRPEPRSPGGGPLTASTLLPSSNTPQSGGFTLMPRRLCRWHGPLGVLPLCLSLSGSAAADDGLAASAADRSSFVLELRTFGGGAALKLRATDESGSQTKPVVDFDAISWGAAARVGWDLGAHVQLGATASVAKYWRIGTLEVHDAQTFDDYYFQFDDSPSLWAPIGAFVEIHSSADLGIFIGLALSLGYVPPVARPRAGSSDAEMYMAGYALEAGYDASRSGPHSFGVFLRYSAWAGGESPLHTDFPESLRLAELTLGARWAFRP